MIDLYGLPRRFPGGEDSELYRNNPLKRVEALEEAFSQDIGDRRFIPYLQLHEFEAYLFCDVTWFRYFYDDHEKEIEALKAISANFQSPELINDGPTTSPSKRIIAVLPDYEDAKPVFGPGIVELIGLEKIRATCSHFSTWLAKLETLE